MQPSRSPIDPLIAPPHFATPPSVNSERLPFNSFHLAAEYNLYRLKALLTSPVPLSPLSCRQSVHRCRRSTSVRGRSAPTSATASEEDEDGRGSLFTSRAFHSSAAAQTSIAASSSASHSLLAVGVDGCCLHIPRWYYEEQLQQVVEEMERANMKHSKAATAAPARTPQSSPATATTRTVSCGVTAALTSGDSSAIDSGLLTSTTTQAAEAARQGQLESEVQAEDETADKCGGGGVVSLGMDVRRLKLLEMATLHQRLDRPHSSPPALANACNSSW